MRLRTLLLVTLIAFNMMTSDAQSVIDGTQQEWSSTTLEIDDQGDVSSNQLDILSVHITDDEEFIYFMFETDREFSLDESEDITLYLDADANANTGFSTQGLGVELTYYFNERFGLSELDGSVNHDDLDLYIAPTVSSTWFEFALAKSSKGLKISGSSIRCIIANDSSGDKVGPIEYPLQNKAQIVTNYEFDKVEKADFRIVSYNVEFDGWFESPTQNNQRNQIKALNPDIVAFQEIYDHSVEDIRQSLEEILPSGNKWNTTHVWSDCYVFSTHPVVATDAIDGNEISLLDIDGNPLIIVNVHLPCCDNNLDRQQEIDRILSVIRDRNTTGMLSFDFEASTPVIITGDFNLVGEGQNYTSLLTGDIVFNSTFGPDVSLDSDGSGYRDANLLQPHIPSNHTWYNPFSNFAPGKLDFFIYSDAELNLENGFVMNTAGLNNNILQTNNLLTNSTVSSSDHQPIVGDFSFESVMVSTDDITQEKLEVYPNPADQYINVNLGNLNEVRKIVVTDLNGTDVIFLNPNGNTLPSIQIGHLQSGVYYLQVFTKDQRLIEPFVIQH